MDRSCGEARWDGIEVRNRVTFVVGTFARWFCFVLLAVYGARRLGVCFRMNCAEQCLERAVEPHLDCHGIADTDLHSYRAHAVAAAALCR